MYICTNMSKTPVFGSFLIKLQVFPCEYCKIFKNIYFEEHLQTAASKNCSGNLDKNKLRILFLMNLKDRHL